MQRERRRGRGRQIGERKGILREEAFNVILDNYIFVFAFSMNAVNAYRVRLILNGSIGDFITEDKQEQRQEERSAR